MELRPYQSDMLDRARGAFAAGHSRVMLMAPVGAGKTVVASAITQSALKRGRNVLFICERIVLVEQAARRFVEDGMHVGILQAKHPAEDLSAPVQCASIQTIARRERALQKMDIGLVIIDEAHIVHKAHIELMKAWSAIPFLGLSATPFTRGLGQYFSALVVGETMGTLIDGGFLVPTTVYSPGKPDMTGVATSAGDFNQKQAAEKMMDKALVGDPIQTWHKLANNERTICFASTVAQSKTLAEDWEKTGVKAEHLDAHTPAAKRRGMFERLKSGETRVLVSVGVLGRGFDEPEVRCVVQCRPTRSLCEHIQQIGRGVRSAPGKTDCLVLDHAGNHERIYDEHGVLMVSDPLPTELDDGKRGEKGKKKESKPMPRPCRQCGFLRLPGVLECPQCGHKPDRRELVEIREGELKLLNGRKRKERTFTQKEKQNIWHDAMYRAAYRNMKVGAAAHMFKKETGGWPRGMPDQPRGNQWQMQAKDYLRIINGQYS